MRLEGPVRASDLIGLVTNDIITVKEAREILAVAGLIEKDEEATKELTKGKETKDAK